jgi:hypothetical protein
MIFLAIFMIFGILRFFLAFGGFLVSKIVAIVFFQTTFHVFFIHQKNQRLHIKTQKKKHTYACPSIIPFPRIFSPFFAKSAGILSPNCPFSAIFGPFLPIFGPFLAILGPFWAILDPIWAIFGPEYAGRPAENEQHRIKRSSSYRIRRFQKAPLAMAAAIEKNEKK